MCFGRPAATLHWALFGYLFKPSLEMQPRSRFRGMVWLDRTAARQVLIQIKVDFLFQLSQVGGAPGDPRDRGHTVAPALACYSVTGSQRRVVGPPSCYSYHRKKSMLSDVRICCYSVTRSHRRTPCGQTPAAKA